MAVALPRRNRTGAPLGLQLRSLQEEHRTDPHEDAEILPLLQKRGGRSLLQHHQLQHPKRAIGRGPPEQDRGRLRDVAQLQTDDSGQLRALRRGRVGLGEDKRRGV